MGSDLLPSPASGTRAFSRPGTVAAILVGCLGLAEFGVVAGGITGAHAVDDMAVELAGTVSAIGALAVLLVVGWWHRVPRASAFQAVSGIVALVLLGGVVTWLTWLGQPAWDSPVGVNPDQSRLIAVVVADVCFGSWLMVARLVSPAPRPPAMGLAAVVLLAGAVGQVGSVIAWMNPALVAGPSGGRQDRCWPSTVSSCSASCSWPSGRWCSRFGCSCARGPGRRARPAREDHTQDLTSRRKRW